MGNQTNRTKQTHITVAALAGLALTLAGCGGAGDASAGSEGQPDNPEAVDAAPTVYNFDSAKVADSEDESFVVTNSAFTVELSDELKAVIPSGKSVAVESFTVTPKVFPTGLCRVDVSVDYADGGLESVKTNPAYADDDSVEESVVGNVFGGNFFDEDQLVDSVPSDEDVEEGVLYLTSDYRNITMVDECNEDDSETFIMTEFPYINPVEDDSYFAHASISVLSGGGQSGGEGVTVLVNGDTAAELSANGNWGPPE